jgi:CheY-like chemotaxis protein
MRVPRVVWVNQPHAASVPDEPWVAPNPDDSRAILVAEDNLINCMLLAKMLHRLGANFKLAQNGEEAFEEYKRHPERYWCVFMDLSMPVADGYTSSRWIRQFERENRLQRCVMVLMYVGEPDIGPRTDVFDYFLEKPFRQCWIQGILDAEREREMRSVASDGFSRGGSV